MKRQRLDPEIEALHNRPLTAEEVAAFLASDDRDRAHEAAARLSAD
jgi:hypothetical protein